MLFILYVHSLHFPDAILISLNINVQYGGQNNIMKSTTKHKKVHFWT